MRPLVSSTIWLYFANEELGRWLSVFYVWWGQCRDKQIRPRRLQEKDCFKFGAAVIRFFLKLQYLQEWLKAVDNRVNGMSPGYVIGGSRRPLVVVNLTCTKGFHQRVFKPLHWCSFVTMTSSKFTVVCSTQDFGIRKKINVKDDSETTHWSLYSSGACFSSMFCKVCLGLCQPIVNLFVDHGIHGNDASQVVEVMNCF